MEKITAKFGEEVGEILERLARLEGRIEELSKRLDDFNYRLSDLRWTMNIWFIILTALIVIFQFLRF